MKYRYAFKKDKENLVKVIGRDLPVSTKQSIEICSFIKNKTLAEAKSMLEKTKQKQLAVPFRRFSEGAGHKKGVKGVAGGKYPFKTASYFLNLFKALEANAQNKGLSSELKIIHACAQRAARPMRYGRKRRISMKRSHVEIVAEEMEPVREEKKKGKKKEKAKKEVKEEAKKPTPTPKVQKGVPKTKEEPELKKPDIKTAEKREEAKTK